MIIRDDKMIAFPENKAVGIRCYRPAGREGGDAHVNDDDSPTRLPQGGETGTPSRRIETKLNSSKKLSSDYIYRIAKLI